jgi:hypothetical protein
LTALTSADGIGKIFRGLLKNILNLKSDNREEITATDLLMFYAFQEAIINILARRFRLYWDVVLFSVAYNALVTELEQVRLTQPASEMPSNIAASNELLNIRVCRPFLIRRSGLV